MVITIICDVLGKENNGTTTAAMNLIRSLKQKGHEVRVVCPDEERRGEPGFFVVEKYDLGPLNGYVAKNGVSLAKSDTDVLRAAIRGADAVHLLVPFGLSVHAIAIAKKEGVAITASFHCQAENITNHLFLMNFPPANRLVYKAHYRNVYRHCDAVHYPTQFIREVFEGAVGKSTNAHVISNGVNACYTRRPADRPEAWRDQFVIVFTGRYSKEKSHRVLIEGIAQSRYADRIRLVFAGSGPLEDKLKALCAKELPIMPEFRFFPREELVDVLNYADLYVHPAEIEIEAIACLEAISCGLVPVISDSPRSATRHFALGPDNLFACNDAADLARRVDYWIEHPAEKEACRAAYLNYAERFRLTDCMDKMEAMLLQAAQNGRDRRAKA